MAVPSELSFLPEDYLERKAQRRTNVVFAILFLCLVGGIGTTFAVSERARREVVDQQTAVERQYLAAAQPLEQFRTLQERQKQMAQQVELSASLLEKVQRSVVLARITNAIPAGLALTDFTLESKPRIVAAPVTNTRTAYQASKAERERKASAALESLTAQPKLYDVYMRLQGIAGTDVHVAQFIARLHQCELFRDVNLVISEEYTVNEQKIRRFQVEMMLNPDAEVQPEKDGSDATALD